MTLSRFDMAMAAICVAGLAGVLRCGKRSTE